jgi:hypothetical protein
MSNVLAGKPDRRRGGHCWQVKLAGALLAEPIIPGNGVYWVVGLGWWMVVLEPLGVKWPRIECYCPGRWGRNCSVDRLSVVR